MTKYIIKVTNREGDSLYVSGTPYRAGQLRFHVKTRERAKRFGSEREAQMSIDDFHIEVYGTTFSVEEW